MLLDFRDGVTVTAEITNSGPDALTFTVLSQGGGLWNPPSWSLEWSTVTVLGDAFLGRTDYGSSGLFTQILKRTGSGVDCEFAIVWPGSGVGDGSCTAIRQ